MLTREEYRSLLDDANVQRGLAVIRQSEDTARYPDPYAVTFGGGTFDYSGGHPGTKFSFTTKSGKSKTTTATGAYQFLKDTWNDVANKLGLENMSAENQDIAALALIDQNGGLTHLLEGDVKGFVNEVGNIWASLPSAPAEYDQPTRSWNEITTAWDNAITEPIIRQDPQVVLAGMDDSQIPTPFDRGAVLDPSSAGTIGTAQAGEMPGGMAPPANPTDGPLGVTPSGAEWAGPPAPSPTGGPVGSGPMSPVGPAMGWGAYDTPVYPDGNQFYSTSALGPKMATLSELSRSFDQSRAFPNPQANMPSAFSGGGVGGGGGGGGGGGLTEPEAAAQLGKTFTDFAGPPTAPVGPAMGWGAYDTPPASTPPSVAPKNWSTYGNPIAGQVEDARRSLNVTDAEYRAQLSMAGLSPSEIDMAVATRAAPPVAAAPAPVPMAQPAPQRAPAPPPAGGAGGAGGPLSLPPPPSGMDVWQGQSPYGVATDGSTLSVNPNGTVSRYSEKFDNWSTFNPDTQQWLPGGGPSGVGVPGPVGRVGQTIGDTLRNPFGNLDAGGMAKSMLGAAMGSPFGPIGSMVGALAAKQLLKGDGKQPNSSYEPISGDVSLGNGSFLTPSRGGSTYQTNGKSYAAYQPRGYTSGDDGYIYDSSGNRTDITIADYDRMSSVSPNAIDAIINGVGGLF